MNPINTINQEFTRVVVAEWSSEAEQCRLAQVVLVQTDQVRGRSQRRGWVSQMLGSLLARLRVAQIGV